MSCKTYGRTKGYFTEVTKNDIGECTCLSPNSRVILLEISASTSFSTLLLARVVLIALSDISEWQVNGSHKVIQLALLSLLEKNTG